MQYSKIRIIAKLYAALLLLCACALQSAFLFAQEPGNSERAAIAIISIEHRDPLFVRSQLMSSLDPRGNIGLIDNKLIIASTAGNLQQLKELVAETDVPARRLVVSVDFEYGSSRADNSAQQSSQALEGDAVSFTDGLPGANSEMPRVVITSVIRGENIDADVEILNVPGFSGNHPITLMFGQWYVINPVADAENDALTGPDFEITAELVTPSTDGFSPMPAEPTPTVAPIAVRVDVLP